MAPPPYEAIPDPIAYAAWKAAQQQPCFSQSAMQSTITKYTVECRAPTNPNSYTKYVFGYTETGGAPPFAFWFCIGFHDNPVDLPEFRTLHTSWANLAIQAGTGQHIYREQPDGCGTQTTPACPPDSLLEGARRYLRDVTAGAGADAGQLQAAAASVDESLLEMITAEILKLGAPLPPSLQPPDLTVKAAIDYLLHLKTWQGATLPSAAAIYDATFEIEQLLAGALKTKATEILLAP